MTEPTPLLSAAAFEDELASVTVGTSQGPLAVTYRPYALTPDFEMKMARSDLADEVFYALFCEVVAEIGMAGPLYDKGDRDAEGRARELVPAGERIPIEPRYVAHLYSRLLDKIMVAIREDLVDGDPKPSNGTSRNGSFVRR